MECQQGFEHCSTGVTVGTVVFDLSLTHQTRTRSEESVSLYMGVSKNRGTSTILGNTHMGVDPHWQ